MDIKQFTRELLEGKPLDTAVIGTVTHAQKLVLYDPDFPPVWLLQVEVNESIYSDICITRDPKLQTIADGDIVMFHKIAPEKEGHPLFLYCSSLPTEKPKAPQPVDLLPKITPVDPENPVASNFGFDQPDPPTKFNAEEKDAAMGPL